MFWGVICRSKCEQSSGTVDVPVRPCVGSVVWAEWASGGMAEGNENNNPPSESGGNKHFASFRLHFTSWRYDKFCSYKFSQALTLVVFGGGWKLWITWALLWAKKSQVRFLPLQQPYLAIAATTISMVTTVGTDVTAVTAVTVMTAIKNGISMLFGQACDDCQFSPSSAIWSPLATSLKNVSLCKRYAFNEARPENKRLRYLNCSCAEAIQNYRFLK